MAARVDGFDGVLGNGVLDNGVLDKGASLEGLPALGASGSDLALADQTWRGWIRLGAGGSDLARALARADQTMGLCRLTSRLPSVNTAST
ncbi:hypothetical protein CHELA40_14610 [Chelatococcus asaccharovorans]|nr:hypothetical protein CHELA17_61010 [Chelatococcus asaccharovorans]CAH1678735.1 hypothetical protein CHELA40_14610 [Chelatococcus asaccharovorans]